MTEPITISAEERDLLHCRIWIHRSGLDKVWLETRPGPRYSDQEAQQIREEMQLILDGLGRRKTWSEEPVALTTLADVLWRVFEFMLHMAGGEGADDDRDEATEDFPEYEDRQVRAMCGRLLGQLDRAPATNGSKNG